MNVALMPSLTKGIPFKVMPSPIEETTHIISEHSEDILGVIAMILIGLVIFLVIDD